jgi:hypothetical protein
MESIQKDIEISIKYNLPSLLEKYELDISNLQEEKIIMKALTYYIFNMIINVCSLLSIISKINNPEDNRIRTKDVKNAIQYIKSNCIEKQNELRGGGNNTNENIEGYIIVYYSSPDYIKNLQNIKIEEVIELFDKSYIYDIFRELKTDISSNTLNYVKKLMKIHLKCFLNDLKKEGKLTIKRIEYVVSKERHFVFT